MQAADLPPDEALRLEALFELDLLDTEPEPELDEIVQLASRLCDTPISLITLIDQYRQWFKARTGMPVRETGRDVAFCAHAILQDDMMVVNTRCPACVSNRAWVSQLSDEPNKP